MPWCGCLLRGRGVTACAAAAWRPVGALRFESGEDERAFAAHLRPRIGLCTVLYHGLVALVEALALGWFLIWEAEGDGERYAEDDGVAGVSSAAVPVLGHTVIAAVLAVTWILDRGRRIPWEALSVCTTSAMCMAYPWTAAQLLGSPCSREAQRVAIFGAAVVAAGFCIYVPMRLAHWPAVPVGVLGSYILRVATAGAPDAREVPVHLGALLLLLALPVGNLWRRERLERRVWLTGHLVAALPEVSCEEDRDDALQAWPDITLHLSEGGLLIRTSTAVHDRFFGRATEGVAFQSFLLRSDRVRLQEAMDLAASSSDFALVETCTLNLPHGLVKAQLRATRVAEGFRVGLSIIEDARPHPQQAPALRGEDSAHFERTRSERGRWLQVLPPGSVASAGERQPTDGQAITHGALSELSMLSARLSEGHTLTLSECSYRVARIPEQTAATQTDAPTLVDAGMNTAIVMDGFSFRCVLCSKPPALRRLHSPDTCAPVIPGPEARSLMEKLDRVKGVARTRSEHRAGSEGNSQYYRGSEFDGLWRPRRSKGDADASEWMRRLFVLGGTAVMGDGSEANLVQVGKRGQVLLCGGELQLHKDGRLTRTSKSGKVVEFTRATDSSASETMSSSSRSEDVRGGRPSKYRGTEFDGIWKLAEDDGKFSPWMRRICILAGRALLGDGSEVSLARVGAADTGPVLLCGGELRFGATGRLERVGKDGRSVEFVSAAQAEALAEMKKPTRSFSVGAEASAASGSSGSSQGRPPGSRRGPSVEADSSGDSSSRHTRRRRQ